MASTLDEDTARSVSGWKRLLTWMKTVEDAIDHVSSEHSFSRLHRKVSALEDAVFELEPLAHSREGAIQ